MVVVGFRGLELGVARVAGEGDGLADVLHARDVAHQPLEPQPVARVRHRPEPPQVQVPPVVLRVQPQLRHLGQQHVQPLLALAAPDQLAHPRHQQVHGGHGLPVLVVPHVEGLDAPRVVVHEGGRAELGLAQPPLVLRLQVRAELHVRVLPLGPVLGDLLLQQRDGLAVLHAREGLVAHAFQPGREALVEELLEELQVLRAVLQNVPHHVLHEGLGVGHVVRQVRKRHLRLDHVELRQVARGLGVLRAEGGAEGVHVAQGARVRLRVQLAGDREEGLRPEEVPPEVDAVRVVLPARQLGDAGGQGAHAEHLARALAVGGGDERRLQVLEALTLEEVVRGVGQLRAHARDGGDGVGARAQVRFLAEELHGGALLLQGVAVARALAHQLHRVGADLELLALAWALDDGAPHRNRASGGQLLHLLVRVDLRLSHHLQSFHAGTVVHLDESERFLISGGADPAFHDNLISNGRVFTVKNSLHLPPGNCRSRQVGSNHAHWPPDRGRPRRRQHTAGTAGKGDSSNEI
mmetsp:Transcript_1845/g.2415  ORF Transcript_1845/g.2415 Transcript_1845/m.2415 type:complete len:522 (-) Transcript_1845:168-1733(-)